MGTRCKKKFDISFIIRKFNANQNLTFEDIAEEFGMTVEEFVERMETKAGDDEKPLVRQAKNNNERRMRRRQKNQKEIVAVDDTAETVEEDSTMEETTFEVDPSHQKKHDALEAKRAEAEANLESAKAAVAALRPVVETLSATLAAIKVEVSKKETSIKKAETQLRNAKAAWEELISQLEAEGQRAEFEGQQLEEAEARVIDCQEILDDIMLELEEHDSYLIYLIDPNFDLTGMDLPETGRLISTIEFDGEVEVEDPESDIDSISLSQAMLISRKTGFKDILEMGTAYQFGCLVVKYKYNPNYEVHVITNDPRMHKMIEVLMS